MNYLIPSSAGTLSVSVVATLFGIFQGWISLKQRDLMWNRWGAMLSFTIAIYSFSVFIQFNTSATQLNRISELIQYTTFIFLIHSLYGFTFSYLSIDSVIYRRYMGLFHILLLVLIWGTDLVISDQFIERNFLWLPVPYIEPELGLIGKIILIYVVIAAAYSVHYWIRYRSKARPGGQIFIIGFLLWAILGIHDALCTLGFTSIQFLMEYGFLGFSISIVSVTIKTYLRQAEIMDHTAKELRENQENLEKRVQERTQELSKTNEELREAMGKVKTLSGMLPICSSCKKIRDDKGYWNQIESYITKHSDADFSHSLCPECVKKLYPDLNLAEVKPMSHKPD